MQETVQIQRHKGMPAEDSFDSLRRSGIAHVQDLTDTIWTDYNLHDPGVTILEQVCYALTDLTYRASFPVPDLLVDSHGVLDWEQQGLLPAESAFPCRPVTALDYRAFILDAVPEVENVQIDAVPRADSTFGGLYKLSIELKQETRRSGTQGASGNRNEEARESAVAEEVRLAFSQVRNLCEDLDSISIVPTADYKLAATVDIRDGADPAQVLAQIYFVCATELAAGLRFESFDRALNEKRLPEDIFQGPFVNSGMVVEDRGAPSSDFSDSHVFRLLKGVEGVDTVKSVSGKIDPPDLKNATLRMYRPQKEEEIGVKIFRRGREVKISLHELSMHFEQLNFADRGPRFSRAEIPSILPRPLGQARNLAQYSSVQYQFPAIYGVGREGVPESASDREKARVRQLKGYLLLFDQPMADYTEMLANLRHLFAIGAGAERHKGAGQKPQRRTYYFQPLDEESFPGIGELCDAEGAATAMDLLNEYRSRDRARRLLDYFLALYGERFPDDPLKRAASTDSAVAEEEVLNAKTNYLKNIGDCTRDRGSARDYCRMPGERATSGESDNRPGLEAILSHLLGFEKEYRESGRGVRIIEHLLLRPMEPTRPDPHRRRRHSFRISVLLPGWHERAKDESFRKFAADTIDSRCPAHLYADIYWLSREEMEHFDALHEDWWRLNAEAQRLRLRPVAPSQGAQHGSPTAAAGSGQSKRMFQQADAAARKLIAFLVAMERREPQK